MAACLLRRWATRQVGMVCGGSCVAASAGLALGEYGGPRAFAEGRSRVGVTAAPAKLTAPDNKDKEVIERRDFVVYDHSGRAVSLRAVHQALTSVQVALIGEYHDDPIAHALELELLRGAYDSGRPVVLSLEMFERDVQGVMSEYLAGSIQERDLLRDARPWPNYTNDYRPMVELARSRGLPVICANAPRRYVSLAGSRGRAALDGLPSSSRAYLPPLPYASASEAYVAKTNGLMAQAAAETRAARAEAEGEGEAGTELGEQKGKEGASEEEGGGCPYVGFSVSTNFLDAQSLWDASMAYSIAQHLQANPGPESLVVHICGKFHTEGRLGIPEHLQGYMGSQSVRLAVVTFVPVPALQVPEGEGALHRMYPETAFSKPGDFVVLTDASRDRSFS